MKIRLHNNSAKDARIMRHRCWMFLFGLLGRYRVCCIGAAIGGIATLCLMAPAVQAAGFCRSPKIVHNYWHALERIPQPHKLPSTGKLGFGPGVLRIYPVRNELLLRGKGIDLPGSNAIVESGPMTRSLNRARLAWFVTSTLARLARRGAVEKVLKTKTQYIEHLGAFGRRDFGFRGGLKTGIYRLALKFESKARRSVGKSELLFRVVEPRSILRLGISSTTFTPNTIGYLRVENLGTVKTTYSYEYELWKDADGSRVKLPPEPMSISGNRPVALGGMTSACIAFRVPDNIPAGRYMIGVRVNNVLLRKPRVLLAQFSVSS
jgi:hypothetical protein